MLTVSLLFGVFLVALMNGWHCALMCGGVASMMEKPTLNSISFVKPSQLFHQQVIMHLGRITTYSILGAIAEFVFGNKILSLYNAHYFCLHRSS